MLNILGNAAKFTKDGLVKLSVGWNQNQKEAQLVFDVEDTGIGIKEEDIDKIFGKFTPGDTRKNRIIQGTGLGLAILTGIAEIGHNGSDAVGRGTTAGVDHNQQLHEVVVDGAAGGLDQEHVAAADRLAEVDGNFAVGELLAGDVAQFKTHCIGDALGQSGIGIAGKQLQFAVRTVSVHGVYPLCLFLNNIKKWVD